MIVTLLDSKGVPTAGQELDVDVKEFNDRVKSRIRNSAEVFLGLLDNEFSKERGPVYIFLAGNSSRSELVKEVFHELLEKSNAGAACTYRLELPMEGEDCREDIPTAKTGVALGLLRWRSGDNILMVDRFGNSANGPVFPYYVGVDDGCGRLRVLAAPGMSPQWIKLQKAGRPECALYYTTNPLAASGELSLDDRSVCRRVVELPISGRGSDWVIMSVRVAPVKIEISIGQENSGKIRQIFKKSTSVAL